MKVFTSRICLNCSAFLFLLMLAGNANAQAIPWPEEGCAIRYLYDDAGNRTVREWHCWTDDPVKSALHNNHLQAFPSPAKDLITVQLEEPVEQADLLIVDATGRQLLSRSYTGISQEIDVSQFSNGLYWIKLTIGEESLVSTFRVQK